MDASSFRGLFHWAPFFWGVRPGDVIGRAPGQPLQEGIFQDETAGVDEHEL